MYLGTTGNKTVTPIDYSNYTPAKDEGALTSIIFNIGNSITSQRQTIELIQERLHAILNNEVPLGKSGVDEGEPNDIISQFNRMGQFIETSNNKLADILNHLNRIV